MKIIFLADQHGSEKTYRDNIIPQIRQEISDLNLSNKNY